MMHNQGGQEIMQVLVAFEAVTIELNGQLWLRWITSLVRNSSILDEVSMRQEKMLVDLASNVIIRGRREKLEQP